MLSRFIDVAVACREMNNFNGVAQITSALLSSPIARLKQTMGRVSKKHKAHLKELEELIDPSGSYKTYRATIDACSPPIIPFQGVYWTDLVFLNENSDQTEEGLINFYKYWQIGRILIELELIKRKPHNFKRVFVISEYLKNITHLSQEEQWTLSLDLEPRGDDSNQKRNSLRRGRSNSFSKKTSSKKVLQKSAEASTPYTKSSEELGLSTTSGRTITLFAYSCCFLTLARCSS